MHDATQARRRGRSFIKNHPLLTYYALVFLISWGGALIVLGPDGFVGLKAMSLSQMPLIFVFVWAGTTVAGIASTVLVAGKAGLRDLRARWTNWRVGWRWYAMALVAPALAVGILFALTLVSGNSAFLPVLITTPDKIGVLVFALAIALSNSFFEEMGWTGFAVPQFRKRYGIVTTGLIVGLVWGAWHAPIFAGDASGAPIAPAAYLAVLLFGWLPAYRILMVWAYDHTKSVLIAWAMHVAIDFNSLAIIPTVNKEASFLFIVLFGAGLWIIALALTATERMQTRQRVSARFAA